MTLSSLHQSTLGTLYLNMPHRLHALWYTPMLPVLFFVSSIMAGLSLATLAYMAATRIAGRPAKPEIVTAGPARRLGGGALPGAQDGRSAGERRDRADLEFGAY